MLNYTNYSAKVGCKFYEKTHQIEDWEIINKIIKKIDNRFIRNEFETEKTTNGNAKYITIKIDEDDMNLITSKQEIADEIITHYLHQGLCLLFLAEDNMCWIRPITIGMFSDLS